MAGTFPTGLGSAWSFGGSLFTFIFPMCLFIVVAAILYLQYSRPHKVPGHRGLAPAREQSSNVQVPPGGQPGQPEAEAEKPKAAE